jgi:D-glycero-D-manno-heptose 1,7-bisphosphate phosphatase
MPTAHARSAPGVFIDKDGTLIENVPYNVDPLHVRLQPGAEDGLRTLQSAGYKIVVVTNQSGVARGYFTEEQVRALGEHITSLLGSRGISLTGFYFCPHLPNGLVRRYALACRCRKPEPGLILEAARRHGLDLARSWIVGDAASDIQAGQRAGCRAILLRDPASPSPPGARSAPDYIATDVANAAQIITGAARNRRVSS